MTDAQTALLERWEQERPMYEAWGHFVADNLLSDIAEAIRPASVDLFVRIPIRPRVKEKGSLVAKAFYREKAYADPYENIEDKVGLRVVVLVSDEIPIVKDALVKSAHWEANLARDYEKERVTRPYEFDYQSIHYVVRSKLNFYYNDVEIVAKTPCEVQIRTILQHAYSELTHDTIYKPSLQVEPEVKRAAAKSMALIEATDDYFKQVRERLNLAAEPGNKVANILDKIYRDRVGLEPASSSLNDLLIDHYKRWAKEGFEDDLSAFLGAKPFVAENVRTRAGQETLYQQPAIILLYWVVSQAANGAAKDSPLTYAELVPIYGDLGVRFPESR